MATTAELRARVALDSGPFSAGIRRVRRQVRRFARESARDVADLSRAMSRLAVVGIGAVAGGYALAARAVMRYEDDTAKAARRTGMAVDEVAALRHQVDLAGGNFEALEKAIARQGQMLWQLERGSREAVDAFGELGLAQDDLDGLTVAQQFQLVSRRLAGVADPARKGALAMAIFGRGGRQLIPVLDQVGAGLDEAKVAADRLGILVSPEQAMAAEQTRDELTRLRGSFLGLMRSAVNMETIARGVKSLTDALVDLRRSVAFQAAARRFDGFVRGIALGTARVIRAFAGMSTDGRAALLRFAGVAGGFVTLWAAGVVQPIIRLTARLVGAVVSMLNAKVLLAGLVGVPAFLEGMALGNALTRAFGLGVLDEIEIGYRAFFENMTARFAAFRASVDAIRSGNLKALQGIAHDLEMQSLGIAAKYAGILADRARVTEAPEGDFMARWAEERAKIGDRIADGIGAGLVKVEGMFDDIIGDPLREFRAELDKLQDMDLPALDDPVARAAEDANHLADDLERAARVNLRPRGIAQWLPGDLRRMIIDRGPRRQDGVAQQIGGRMAGAVQPPRDIARPQDVLGGAANHLAELVKLGKQQVTLLDRIAGQRIGAF